MNQSKTAIPFYQLESKRLIIRPWKETDFSAFKAMNSDPLVMEHFPAILSEDESRTLFDEINRRIDQNGFDFWTCEVKATSDVIGFVGLNKPTDQFYFSPCIEIGWRLRSQYWRQGYAKQAIRKFNASPWHDKNAGELLSSSLTEGSSVSRTRGLSDSS